MVNFSYTVVISSQKWILDFFPSPVSFLEFHQNGPLSPAVIVPEVIFLERLYPVSIQIYETYNPGAIVRIMGCDYHSGTNVDTGRRRYWHFLVAVWNQKMTFFTLTPVTVTCFVSLMLNGGQRLWCLPPVWNLRAVILIQLLYICSLVPSFLALSVYSYPFLLLAHSPDPFFPKSSFPKR